MAKNEIKVYTVVDATGAKTGIALTEKEFAKLAPAAEKAATGSTKHLQGLASSLPGVGGAISGLTSKMSEAGHVSTDLGGSFGGMGAKVAGSVAVAGVAMAEFAFKGAEKFGDLTLSVEKFKEVSGTTAQDASRWVAVSTDYGVAADAVAGSVGKLGKALGNNSGALDKYGVSAVLAKDGTVDLNATLFKVIDAYNATEDAAKKDALASAAFGKGYQALIPLLDVGSSKIKDAFGKVHGAEIFDDKKLEQGKEFRKSMDEIHKATTDLEMTLGKQLIPTIEAFSKVASVASEVSQGFADKLGMAGPIAMNLLNPIGLVATGYKEMSGRIHDAAVEMANADKQTGFEKWSVKELHFLPSFAGDADVIAVGASKAEKALSGVGVTGAGSASTLDNLAASTADYNIAVAASTEVTAKWKVQTDAALVSVQKGLDQTKFKWDVLTGAVTDDQAWLNLQQAFDDTKTKGTAAMETIAQRVADLRKQGMTLAEAQKQAAIDDAAAKRASALQYDELKLKVIAFGNQVDGLPLEKVTTLLTEIKAGELQRVEDQLAILTRNRTVNLDIIAKGGAGYGAPIRDSGGPVLAGQPYWIGVNRQPELFVPGQSGRVMTTGQLSAMAAGGGSPAPAVRLTPSQPRFSLPAGGESHRGGWNPPAFELIGATGQRHGVSRGVLGGGTTVTNHHYTYNVNVPPNFDKVAFGRVIEESRAAHQRSGGTMVS